MKNKCRGCAPAHPVKKTAHPVKAVFTKQAKDMFKNPIALLPFIIFPVVALIMTELVAKGNDDIDNNLFVAMMASIFAGFGLLQSAAAIISEDMEKKSLRYLVMAGVKPHQYLLGIGGFLFAAATIVSAIFGFIGGYSGMELLKFLTIMLTGVAAAIVFGLSIGMLSKNQQAAAAMSMPAAVIIGFTPMIAGFNETVEKFAGVLYTQQISIIVNDFSANITKPLMVIAANIVVFAVLFVVAYKKKGLTS
ncbi:MAG: ABC transporter permease [Oscillospiraceae bacterium]|nr:ABC transporter permease [Oscillospiraceae bacterium]